MTPKAPRSRAGKLGADPLPADDDLSAFARSAFPRPTAVPDPPAATAPAQDPVVPAGDSTPAPRPPVPPVAALVLPAAAPQPAVPDMPAPATAATEAGDLIIQATVLVSVEVHARFGLYQSAHERTAGYKPSNTEVVAAALNAGAGRYAQIVAARQPQPQPGQRFGAPVRGRRATAAATPTTQLAFRPTLGEKADIKRLAAQSGARSMSAFIDAVLDEFLPPMQGRRRA